MRQKLQLKCTITELQLSPPLKEELCLHSSHEKTFVMQIKSVHTGNLWGITDACYIHILTSSALASPCKPAFHPLEKPVGAGTGGTRPAPAIWKTCWASAFGRAPKDDTSVLPSWKCLSSQWSVLSGNVTSALWTIILGEQIKNNANCLMYFRKSNPLVISGPFWEHDGALGTLEIFWGVPGHPKDNIGWSSLCGWNLCKIQLKAESKDMATLTY